VDGSKGNRKTAILKKNFLSTDLAEANPLKNVFLSARTASAWHGKGIDQGRRIYLYR
jgi:hypothetical protein